MILGKIAPSYNRLSDRDSRACRSWLQCAKNPLVIDFVFCRVILRPTPRSRESYGDAA